MGPRANRFLPLGDLSATFIALRSTQEGLNEKLC